MSKERQGAKFERVTEFLKKLDILQIGAGTLILLFNANLGGVIIFGSALTYITTEEIERSIKAHRKKKRS